MGIRAGELVIDDSNCHLFTGGAVVNGEAKGTGYVPRDYAVHPAEMFAQPSEMQLIPQHEWSARIKELEDTKSRISDIRRKGNKNSKIPSLDQGNYGYCWAHSSVMAFMLERAIANQPYIPLSAFAVAAIIKNYRNEGGWCGLSAKFLREVGVPSQATWPLGRVDRSLDTAAMRAEANGFRVVEDWVDLTTEVYNQNLTFAQVMTCLLSQQPLAVDFNWWGHSVCAMDAVEVEPGSFGIRILNSWTDLWGLDGEAVLRGSQATPNGAIAIRGTTARGLVTR